MKINNTFKLIISLVIPQLAGGLGSYFTIGSVKDWYPVLVKPALNPPAWIFGPVWTTLFLLMGYALYLVWSSYAKASADKKDESGKSKRLAYWAFGIQMVLNTLWSIIFFGLHSPGGALFEMIFLWLAILATIIVFAKISRPAMWLLLPYILWVSFAGYLNYSIWQLNSSANLEQIACTEEAKLCPDGSYVGRTGPKCEFAQCPDEANNDLWKLSTDGQTGISFKYPGRLLTDYIFTQSWPPKVAVSNNDHQLNCLETPAESSLPQRVAKRIVDNRTYCVEASSEGAAGSVYTTYDYSTIKDDKLVTVSFTLIYPQCDNYDDPQKTTCKNERTSFDLDSTVDRIVQTIKLGSK